MKKTMDAEKKMSNLTLEITDIAHGGLGVGRDGDRVIFVRGALPGETVDVEVVKERAKWARAVVREVVVPSVHRIEPVWREGMAGATGAADFSHVELTYQRELKTMVLRSAIRRVGGVELHEHLAKAGIEPVVSAVDNNDGWGTRTRVDLIKMSHGFGMHKEQSHDLVSLTQLPLVVPDLAQMIFNNNWDSTFKSGKRIRFVAPSTGENVAVCGGKVYSAPQIRANYHVSETVAGDHDFYDYRVAADGFWQVHFRAPGVLQREVVSHAGVRSGDGVLELFSGAGLFSVPLARATGKRGRFLGIEGAEQASADATKNLAGLSWAEARTMQLHNVLPEFGADVIVADPPRNGLGVGLADQIGRSQARRIVLVSCDPAAAARDVAAMVATGRRVLSMNGFDIFPHTHHLEVVTTLG
ncbi:class I SAM-dependent RNA methyltransferase [Arcanobacterium buesumense]|uniref:Class I SAM-dependent RNA methyltransferase n=1 Tax=Arcanobacterium buesumense TaxID=2722751 RepID=A0A6H2EJF6_9ACTO|nr:TRAM domain-containing protein [Arcanobacterium buesumense]QJC21698.1 class I SAM-dependent RNA methyltransferase [Arcanobacterium buesumense]